MEHSEVILPVGRVRSVLGCQFGETGHKSGCGKCEMRRAPGVLFGVFGVCLGPKWALFMRKD